MDPDVPEWAARLLFDRIGRALALTPRAGFAAAVCRVARLAEERELASLTAYGQELDACMELFAASEQADEEFLACLLQELLLRHGSLEPEPFASFWAAIQSQGHPLARLPLRLTSVEEFVSRWLPSYTWPGHLLQPDIRPDNGPQDVPGGAEVVAAFERETTVPADKERISAAVATWLPHGSAETRVFSLRANDPVRPLAGVLADAGLECLGGRGPSRVDAIAPSQAFDALFPAASTGGAYDKGNHGAYGRLKAWETMSALVGAPADKSIEKVAELAERSRWFRFETDSGWFYEVVWDIALATVSADGSRLAIVAATDSD